jgi:ATP-dependent RNA helicase DDX42
MSGNVISQVGRLIVFFLNARNEIISAFKRRDFPVLVATDVAARGLDIPHIRNVINFDVAR